MMNRRTFVRSSALAAAAISTRKSFAKTPEASRAQGWRTDWYDQSVIDLRMSPFAKLHPIPVHAATLHAGFWNPRRTTNLESSIPSMRVLFEEHGRMDNFRRLQGKSSAPKRGNNISDSDVYKWVEAASFAQQSYGKDKFRDHVAEISALILGAQQKSGYLSTFYVDDLANMQMLPNTQEGHELYCIGHLIQAAVAQYRATGDRRLVECSLRFVDQFLLPQYGPGKKPIISGHPEIEMGLVELYRIVGDNKHLAFADYLYQGDPRIVLPHDRAVYLFCGPSFFSRTHLEGHAVRVMYSCAGATDYFLETGDQRYWETLNMLWDDLVRDQMYVTGAVGARRKDEAFGDPYELPNAHAYAETCASIGNAMWNWRMLHASPEVRFADIMEVALYNGMNAGMALSGTEYCYRNPLAFEPGIQAPMRNKWYETPCCLPNMERMFASLPAYFFSTSKDGLYVHLFDNIALDWKLESGTPVRIEQSTNYPWNGAIKLVVHPARPEQFTLHVRIPGWADGAGASVAGEQVQNVVSGEYLSLKRKWTAGDVVEVNIPLRPRLIAADDHVSEDRGKVAVQRGPVVYCLEGIDQSHPVRDLYLQVDGNLSAAFTVRHEPDLLGGVDLLEHEGLAGPRKDERASGQLYQELSQTTTKPVTLRFIPYYAWANRQTSDMAVWIPFRKQSE